MAALVRCTGANKKRPAVFGLPLDGATLALPDLKTLADAANGAAKREATQWFVLVTLMVDLAVAVGSTTYPTVSAKMPPMQRLFRKSAQEGGRWRIRGMAEREEPGANSLWAAPRILDRHGWERGRRPHRLKTSAAVASAGGSPGHGTQHIIRELPAQTRLPPKLYISGSHPGLQSRALPCARLNCSKDLTHKVGVPLRICTRNNPVHYVGPDI
jgi:hypothetical protein